MNVKYLILIVISYYCCSRETTLENEFQQLQSDMANIAAFKTRCENIVKDPQRNERQPEALFYLGRLNELFAHYEEAIRFYRNLLIMFPDHVLCPESLYRTAYIYTNNLDNKNEAKGAFNQLIYFFPNNPFAEKAMIHYAQLSCEQKAWQEAVDVFDRYIRKYPEGKIREEVAFRIADIMQSGIKDTVKAEVLYTQFINAYPDSKWRFFAERKRDAIKKSGVRSQESEGLE